MPAIILKTPQAEIDLLGIASYIAEANFAAAERFLEAAEQTFTTVASMPLIGQACEFQSAQAQGLRLWRVRGFERYLIFYRPLDNGSVL
jgi:toxin ParE1/3/4